MFQLQKSKKSLVRGSPRAGEVAILKSKQTDFFPSLKTTLFSRQKALSFSSKNSTDLCFLRGEEVNKAITYDFFNENADYLHCYKINKQNSASLNILCLHF